MEEKHGQIVEQYVDYVRDFSASCGSKMSASFEPCTLIGPPTQSLRTSLPISPQVEGKRSCCLSWWKEALSPPKEFTPQSGKIQSRDFVEVSFKMAVYPQEVLVFEKFSLGTLVRIWALGPTSWVLLWEGEPITVDKGISYVSPPIKQVDFPTQILRLEFSHRPLPYFTEIDAIMLRGKNPTGSVKFSKTSQLSIEQGALVGGKCEELSTSVSVDASVDEGPQGTGFHSLPHEILLTVFKYFDMPTLSRCAQVNKQFNSVASDATLYKRMNFRPYWHSLRSEDLLALAPKCRLLQKLDLSWCGSHLMIKAESVVRFLEETGANLTHLRMNNCKFVNDSVLGAIVCYAPNLEELSLRSVTDCRAWSVLEGLVKLKWLDLYGTNINVLAAVSVIMSNPGLQYLNLGSCKRILAIDQVAHAVAYNCPDITLVDLLKSSSLTHMGHRSLKQCKKLKILAMNKCYMSVSQDDSSDDDDGSPKAFVNHTLYL